MFEGSDTSGDIGIEWCCTRIATVPVFSYLFARFWPLLRTSMFLSLGWSLEMERHTIKRRPTPSCILYNFYFSP